MTKRLSILFVNLLGIFAFLACGQLTTNETETTTSTNVTTSTTYYPVMNERVYYHFESIDFSSFVFVEARYYENADLPEKYTVLDVNESLVTDAVGLMFDKFDAEELFPYKSSRFMKYRLYFTSGSEDLIITLNEVENSPDSWMISFIHLQNDVEIYSQQYKKSFLETEFDKLFGLLNKGCEEA